MLTLIGLFLILSSWLTPGLATSFLWLCIVNTIIGTALIGIDILLFFKATDYDDSGE